MAVNTILRKSNIFSPLLLLVTLGLPVLAFGQGAVTLEPDIPSGQPVGTPVTWTVSTGIEDATFRFSAARAGGPLRVIYDYGPRNRFPWTPYEDGTHVLVVSTRNPATGEEVNTAETFAALPRATDTPVITPTGHPLVALYSAPECGAGDRMRVVYWPRGDLPVSATPAKSCAPGHSMNFLVGGLREKTPYVMVHETLRADGTHLAYGPLTLHRTGTIDAELPVEVPVDPIDKRTSLLEDVILYSPLTLLEGADTPVAVDLWGRPIWYYDSAEGAQLARPVDGGTFLVHGDVGAGSSGRLIQEVDLAGNVVRETSSARISEQLALLGQDPLVAFHHEARRLPDGRTAVIGSVERILEDVQGEGPVNILGDYVVVLDRDWQLVWAWNSFDHMDVTRAAVLGEVCTSDGLGCPYLSLGETANDWLHSNAVTYSETDGNLLVSMRHQDWIVKIDYRDGAGTGEVLWRLGPEGDFALISGDPSGWFSHQHDPNFAGGNRLLAVYDNGNTRCADVPNPLADCSSRGQVYALDEEAMTATLVVNADLNNYSIAFGSAQPLLNGNLHFGSGARIWWIGLFSTADEVLPDGRISFSSLHASLVYRSFRLPDLYTYEP